MLIEEKFEIYLNLLQKWQKTINLVGPSTLATARTRHIEDSLQISSLIPKTATTLYDLGSGAGFPGLVLAMARRGLEVHLIESDERKCQFLKAVSRETETPIIIHPKRIESLNLPPPSIITARALADLTVLLGLTSKWWAVDRELSLIFPKGEKFENELKESQKLYSFEHNLIPSQIDGGGRILVLSNIQKL